MKNNRTGHWLLRVNRPAALALLSLAVTTTAHARMPTAIPEPSILTLLGIGVVVSVIVMRLRKDK